MLRTGEYGLEMYANQPLRDEDTYWHICQYLISYPGAEGGPRDDNQADPGLVLLAKEFGLVSPSTPKHTVTLYAMDHFLRGYYSVRDVPIDLTCDSDVLWIAARAEFCKFVINLFICL